MIAPQLDHVAVLVRDLDAAKRAWTEELGFSVVREAVVEDLGVATAFLDAGSATVELFTLLDEQRLDEELAGRDARLDHVAFRVEGLGGLVDRLCVADVVPHGPGDRERIDAPISLGPAAHAWLEPAPAGGITLQLTEAVDQ